MAQGLPQDDAPDDEENVDGYDAAREVYKNRRDAFIRDKFGLTPEEVAAARETGLLDATDLNLITADATYRLFGGFGASEKKIAKVRSAEKDVHEVVRVVDELKKTFGF